jgi:hypothetical protein
MAAREKNLKKPKPTAEKISEGYAQLQVELRELKVRYARDESNLYNQLQWLQDHCSHEETKFYPDPSGGGDSFYECLIYHKEATEL